MRYLIVGAAGVREFESPDKTAQKAMRAAGLKPGEVDYAMVRRDLGIFVYEYGLYTDADKGGYFALNRQLYKGPAVLYGVGERGETVDAVLGEEPVFFNSRAHIEKAIALGLVGRPEFRINGELIWTWPDPPPPHIKEAMAEK